MGQQKKWRPEREPDVETRGFKLMKFVISLLKELAGKKVEWRFMFR